MQYINILNKQYIVTHLLQYKVLLNYCMKKDKHFSFRTTEDNLNYLRQLGEFEDRTPSYILNRMIEAFRNRGVFTIEQIN